MTPLMHPPLTSLPLILPLAGKLLAVLQGQPMIPEQALAAPLLAPRPVQVLTQERVLVQALARALVAKAIQAAAEAMVASAAKLAAALATLVEGPLAAALKVA